jgi:hypothetical protein
MVQREVTGRNSGPSESTEHRDAYSIPEFCHRHNISRGTYYNLKSIGRGPRQARAMGRVIITIEAARDWRRDLELLEASLNT